MRGGWLCGHVHGRGPFRLPGAVVDGFTQHARRLQIPAAENAARRGGVNDSAVGDAFGVGTEFHARKASMKIANCMSCFSATANLFFRTKKKSLQKITMRVKSVRRRLGGSGERAPHPRSEGVTPACRTSGPRSSGGKTRKN